MPIRPLLLNLKSRLSGRFLFGLSLVTVGFICLVGLSDELDARQESKNDSLPRQLANKISPDYYAAIAEKAIRAGPAHYPLAQEASLRALALNKNDVSAWNRLAWLDVNNQGQLTQEGLAALYKSYTISPYGDIDTMIWRTEFSSRIWSALPDDLRAATLRQIPVIGKFGSSWEWRISTCKYNPHKDIYKAACAVAPGVVRPRGRSPAPPKSAGTPTATRSNPAPKTQ